MTKWISHQRPTAHQTRPRETLNLFLLFLFFSVKTMIKLLGFGECGESIPIRLLHRVNAMAISWCLSYHSRSAEKLCLNHQKSFVVRKAFLRFSHSYDKHENCPASADFTFASHSSFPWHLRRAKQPLGEVKNSQLHMLIIYYLVVNENS